MSRSESLSIGRAIRNPGANSESLESVALIVGAAAFVVGLLVAMVVFWADDVPISGPGSIAQFAGVASAVVALVVYPLGRSAVSKRSGELAGSLRPAMPAPGAKLHWFDILAISIAHAVIALLGWIALGDVLEASFQGAVLYPLPAMVLGGVALAMTAYIVFLSSVRLTPMLLSLVVAVFLVVGALTAMLSASDPQWWKENLSALGMTDDFSARTFNLTLIVAGAMVTIIARYATAVLPAGTPELVRNRNIVRGLLVLIGIFLACVGIFPVDEFLAVHNTVATGMAVAFIVIVIGLRWFVPSFPKPFLWFGYALSLAIVISAGFFFSGYYNLTAVELIAGVAVFGWIIVFLRTAGAVGDKAAGTADVASAVAVPVEA
ncbi:DUF998 domain-containing protein [Agromyces soli]